MMSATMHASKTGCLGEKDLSCTYLAHHELGSVIIVIIIPTVVFDTTVVNITMPAGNGAVLQDVAAAAAPPLGPAQ